MSIGIFTFLIICKHFDDPEVSGDRSAQYLPNVMQISVASHHFSAHKNAIIETWDCVFRLGEVMLLIKEVQTTVWLDLEIM